MNTSLLLLLTACSGGVVELTETTSTVTTSTITTTTPVTSSTGTETTTTTTTSSTTTIPPGFTVSATLHEEIGSIVYVTWELSTAAEGYVEYSFENDDWMQSPTKLFEAGTNTEMLLGVPFGETVEARAVLRDGELVSNFISITTDDVPNSIPTAELMKSDSSQWAEEDKYLYTSINASSGGWTGGNYWKIMLDRQARVVWALLTPHERWTLWPKVSYDGQYLMWDEITVYDWGSPDPSMIHKMTIDGEIIDTYEAEGLHHAWDELSDGSFVWGAEITNNEEYLQRLNPDGSTETIWKCSDFEEEMLGHTANSCHSNSWFWHEATDSYLVSFPSSAGQVKDTVLHIDAEGNTLSTWGQLTDWTFENPANTFDYQHGVTFTDTGTLMVSTQLTNDNPYYQNNYDTLAVREYVMDYGSKTLRQIWAFGEDQGIAGNYNGDAHRLANGNTLHNFGTGARTREITADGELIWDIKWPDGNSEGSGRLQGRSIWLSNLYDFAPK